MTLFNPTGLSSILEPLSSKDSVPVDESVLYRSLTEILYFASDKKIEETILNGVLAFAKSDKATLDERIAENVIQWLLIKCSQPSALVLPIPVYVVSSCSSSC